MRRSALVATTSFAFAVPAAAADPPISIHIQPSVATAQDPVQVFGRVNSQRADEVVEVQQLQCRGYGVWLTTETVTTTSFGAWTSGGGVSVTTKFRARWHGFTSGVVSVRVRPFILLDANRRGRLLVIVRGNDYFRSATLQRRVGSRWVRVRAFRLHSAGPASNDALRSTTELKTDVPHGTLLRVVMSQSQVGRCYLPAASSSVRTP